jgi:hypothetical protein
MDFGIPSAARLTSAAARSGVRDQGAQVIQIAGQPVHTVHDDGVPVTGEPHQFRQLRPLRVPARGLIREYQSRIKPSSWRFSF